jgi:acyl-CoA dehydrogenase
VSWDFETDEEFAAELAWIEDFVASEVEPLDYVINDAFDMSDPLRQALIPPRQRQVQERGLWAAHLGPHLGGPGYGQVKLALMNEILGRTRCGPIVFGCQAPDSGNAEILAHYGTELLKSAYLEPLLRGEIVSCFSMTEPTGGSDPTLFTTCAVLAGDEWIINGEKWFSSNASTAAFVIVMASTEPDASPHKRQSLLVVPSGTPGIEIIRDVALAAHAGKKGTHAYIRYNNVRVPADHLLGERGGGFAVAQTRLGGGRIHHAMRTVGLVRHALDMMCERALSRSTRDGRLADLQMVQEMIADSWLELEQFRLLVLQTAWRIDRYNDYTKVRADISAVKAAMPRVLGNVAGRAAQIHGSLGVSDEMPFARMVLDSLSMGLADGATEVHRTTLAKAVLRDHVATDGLFPTRHVPRLREAAREKFAAELRAADVKLPL